MSEPHEALHLFEAVGFEVEYMIVDADELRVLPSSDWLLERFAGRVASEVDVGDLSWSNELALHVLELKTTDPVSDLAPLSDWLTRDVSRANVELAARGGFLLPTAMHPLMDPVTETHLWPHEHREVYQAFDAVFDCHRHGWSNLQSVHINLPFSGDAEFGALHAAIRAVLPVLPMLAASSPLVESGLSGQLDSRICYYRHNCDRVPIVTGELVPEPVFTRASYEERILVPIREALAAYDRDGVIDPIWANARGAIARFDRGSIEIRLLDTQECATADVAIVAAACALIRGLVEERWSSEEDQRALPTSLLADVLMRAAAHGSRTWIGEPELLRVLGVSGSCHRGCELWALLVDKLLRERLMPESTAWLTALGTMTERGCLASRIVRAVGNPPRRERILAVYRELADCLAHNRMFVRP